MYNVGVQTAEWAKFTEDFTFIPSRADIEQKAILFLLQYPSLYHNLLLDIEVKKLITATERATRKDDQIYRSACIELEVLKVQYDVYTHLLDFMKGK